MCHKVNENRRELILKQNIRLYEKKSDLLRYKGFLESAQTRQRKCLVKAYSYQLFKCKNSNSQRVDSV